MGKWVKLALTGIGAAVLGSLVATYVFSRLPIPTAGIIGAILMIGAGVLLVKFMPKAAPIGAMLAIAGGFAIGTQYILPMVSGAIPSTAPVPTAEESITG